jgi:amino acid transporter
MLERFKRTDDRAHGGGVATAERTDDTVVDDRERTGDTAVVEREPAVADRPVAGTGDAAATPAALEAARVRQRDEFGGVNWGASFFGWLVAVGVAALLVSILVAAGAAVGLTESDVTNSADEITLGGAIALIAVLMIAYYAGGYVAGRMSRFDGARQGLATWAIGLIVTVGLALAAVILGDEYNVLEQLNLPALPVGDETLATGGAIALAAIAVGSAIAAMAGGKVGERYHRRVDRAGFVD